MPLEYSNRIFSVADASLNYVDWGGSGSLTHIAHATGLNAGVYSPMVEKLKAHFNCIGLDLRGHGRSETPVKVRTLKSWEIFYNDLECFFEHLDRLCIAIGHSLGGTASLVVSAKRPDLVSGLILIEPYI